jgi:pimeloyl-ACP methyl ester carboxylesterase
MTVKLPTRTRSPQREPFAGHLLANFVNDVARFDAVAAGLMARTFSKLFPHLATRFSAHAPLPPRANLPVPTVMFTGLFMSASSFDPMAKQFSGRSYAVYDVEKRAFFIRGQTDPISEAEAAGMKCFEVQFPNREAAPEAHVPEIEEALAAIKRVTKAETVDSVVHSAAGKAFQAYLQHRVDTGNRVVGLRRMVGIGSVTEGTEVGNVGALVSKFTGDVLGFGDASKSLGFGSDFVRHLNEHWPEQMKEISETSTIISVTGAPTLTADGKLASGDGFTTPEDAAKLGGVNLVVLRSFDPTFANHLAETQYTGVIGAVQKALLAAKPTQERAAPPVLESWFEGIKEVGAGTGSADQIGWLLKEAPPKASIDGKQFLDVVSTAHTTNLLAKTDAKDYVYMMVPGLFTKHYPGYMKENVQRLRDRGLSVELAPINTDEDVKDNAAALKDAIEALAQKSGKQVILIGHSKGCVDAAEALETYPSLTDKVRGVIAMQGPFGGTPISSDIEGCPSLRKFANAVIDDVLGGDDRALSDLGYAQRRADMSTRKRYDTDKVPTLCLATTTTSPWSMTALPAFYMRERYGELGQGDGLVLWRDALYPGSHALVLDPPPGIGHADPALYPVPGSGLNPADATEALVAMLLRALPPPKRGA